MMGTFTPVAYEYYEILEEHQQKQTNSIIHYFKEEKVIESASGKVVKVLKEKDGDFVLLSSDEKVRLDTIITIYGRPGPAFDIYDSYANACFSCLGGMD
jgi:hypothetical protein